MPTYLTTPEVATVLRLLVLLQGELKLSIDCHTPPSDADDARLVKLWTRERASAKALVAKIERRVRRGP